MIKREGEGLIKSKNGIYFYYFGEIKGHREKGFYMADEDETVEIL